jgi:hypothetical protein
MFVAMSLKKGRDRRAGEHLGLLERAQRVWARQPMSAPARQGEEKRLWYADTGGGVGVLE